MPGTPAFLRLRGATRRATLAVALMMAATGFATACTPMSARPVAGTATPTASAAPAPTATTPPAPTASSTPTPTPTPTTDPAPDTATAVLETLPVKGRAPKTGYDRDEFGQRWLDVDRNGCDTRNDILFRDLVDVVRSGPCTVMSGLLADPFTGGTIVFERGQDTSALVQIDHVVVLSDAWQKGAQQLTPEQRAAFANDPLNLLAVDGSADAQKGDGDAATWLPKNRAFRCAYVARQVAVKAAYALWVTPAEHDTIARVLDTCPGEPLPTATVAARPAVDTAPAPRASAAPERPVTTPTSSATPARPIAPTTAPTAPAPDVHYANCTAVRAAGAAPIRSGDPGYSRTLDRDGDGIACE